MTPPFAKAEYAQRLQRTRQAMQQREIDALVIGDPSNINWLTGYDAWSFYTPQIMVVGLEMDPVWIGREMDAGAARFTTYLKPEQIVPYPETLVQTEKAHPAQFMADWMVRAGLDGKKIGYENNVYYFTPLAVEHLKAGLPNARWSDGDLLVNWVRVVKNEAEIEMIRKASVIAELAMQTAYDGIRPGIRQCDLMADVAAAQIRGTADFGGDTPALPPLVLAGEAASTAHPIWTDDPFEQDQTVAFELAGCRKRYNAGLARTVHLGKPPQTLLDTAQAVNEGLNIILSSLKADVSCTEIHAMWEKVLNRYGLEKKSRIGYSIGVGYAPDWGEHTLSFRPNEDVPVPENAVIHIILGMWMAGWGMELSETIHVRKQDAICLTHFPREVYLVA